MDRTRRGDAHPSPVRVYDWQLGGKESQAGRYMDAEVSRADLIANPGRLATRGSRGGGVAACTAVHNALIPAAVDATRLGTDVGEGRRDPRHRLHAAAAFPACRRTERAA